MSFNNTIRQNTLQRDLIKPLSLKTLISSYAMMTVEQQKSFNEEFWYQHALQVNKFFKKKKPTPVTTATNKRLMEIYDKVKDFDADFFEDKKFSPYLPMILILDYMIYEVRDVEMRSKFLHLDTRKVIEEMEKTSWLREIGIETHKYVSGILDIIEGVG